jgi:hypothetical protein
MAVMRPEPAIRVACLLDGSCPAISLPRAARGLQCLSGSVWVTEEGVATDVVLRAGEVFVASGTGRVVVEGCQGPAVVRVLRA